MKILFYTTRTITGDISGGLLYNLRILETVSKDIDFLSPMKTEKGVDHINSLINLRVTHKRLPDMDIKNFSSWKEVYDNIDPSPLKDYKQLFIIGGIHFPQSNLTRFSKRAKTFPIDDRGQLKFQQFAIPMLYAMTVHKAHVMYDIPLHEFSYDSDEFLMSFLNVEQKKEIQNAYHLYDMPKHGLKRLDTLQYFFKQRERVRLFEIEKKYDLTFAYTIYNLGNRKSYKEWVNKVCQNFKRTDVYFKDAITKEARLIPREQYLEQLEESSYTLIIPSYDETCFSLYRFIEALERDCLPLIHENCYREEVEKSFSVDLSPLVRKKPFESEEERLNQLLFFKNIFLKYEQGFVNI